MQTDTQKHADEVFLQTVTEFMAALLSNPKINAGYRKSGGVDTPERPYQELAKMAFDAAIEMNLIRSSVQKIQDAEAEAIRTKGDTQ